MAGSMERQQLGFFQFRRGEVQNPLRQIPNGQTVGRFQIAARIFGLHGKV